MIKIQGAFNRKMDDTAMRDTLQFMIDNSMINLDDVRANMRKEEEKRLLSKHKYEIFQGSDGRWKTTVLDDTKKNGRRLIAKSSEEKLRKELIKYYATQEDDQYIQKYDPNSVTLETI